VNAQEAAGLMAILMFVLLTIALFAAGILVGLAIH
jgi:hypothetical protein